MIHTKITMILITCANNIYAVRRPLKWLIILCRGRRAMRKRDATQAETKDAPTVKILVTEDTPEDSNLRTPKLVSGQNFRRKTVPQLIR